MTPDDFKQACALLLGQEWHRAVARELGPHHPDGPRPQIDDRLVRRWAAGEREIPPWVPAALLGLLEERARKHRAAADRLQAAADGLRAAAAKDSAPTA